MSDVAGEWNRDAAQIRGAAAAAALDRCAPRQVRFLAPVGLESMTEESFGATNRDGRLLEVVCPKYPDGTEYVREAMVDNNTIRGVAALRLGCTACEFRKGDPERVAREAQASLLHQKLQEVAGRVYIDGHYGDAVLRGCVKVQDTLYELSGFNTAQEAMGKGGLVFRTSRMEKVQVPHEQAARFALMSVDNMRNEEAHAMPSADELARGAAYAYPRLMLCSLALDYLDSAEIRQ